MIVFKKLYFKNFQSVGNSGITIQLDRSPTTVVGGKNGSGKSNVSEAFSYACFGKSLKKVKLAGLINSINKKQLLVELEFEGNGHTYKIVRGEKPKKLEFYKDGEMLDQKAAAKDTQAQIEYVLGFDYKTFCQMMILNKERFVPFMEQAAGDRRKIVEDILDISILSVMRDNIKKRLKDCKNDLVDIDHSIDVHQTKIEGKKELIEEAKNNTDSQINYHQGIIDEETTAIADLETKIENLEQEIEEQAYDEKFHNKKAKAKREYEDIALKFKNKIKEVKTDAAFFSNNDVCPKCEQGIDDTIKQAKATEFASKEEEIQNNIALMGAEYKKVVDTLSEIEEKLEGINALNKRISEYRSEVKQKQRTVKSSESAIEAIKGKSSSSAHEEEVKRLESALSQCEDDYKTKTAEKKRLLAMQDILKDDAVKAVIVRDYIDFINKKINEYLNAMEFFLNITLDENFNEKINAVNKEDFTYESLSTGQKCRVNLAIWLALLEVASVKNSTVCNVVFLDEILENLDQDGVQLFMKLCNEKLTAKNIFVVTQRFEEFRDYFRSEIQFVLNEQEFTELA